MSFEVDSDNYDLESLNHLTKEVIYFDNFFFSLTIMKTSE